MSQLESARRPTPGFRERFGFYMFDFANSSYTTLIVTVAYSTYFRQAVVGADDPRGDLLWSLTQVLTYSLLILVSPIIGALADESGRKKRLLLWSSAQTVLACALLFFVGPGDWILGVALYLVATIGFEAGYVFYNAFLPEVSTPQTMGRVSGWSWGLGFLGGLAALLACLPLLRLPLIPEGGTGLDLNAVGNFRLAFVVVAAFFALFAIPAFLFLPGDRTLDSGSSQHQRAWHYYIGAGFSRYRQTLIALPRYRQALRFILGACCFYGGIEAVIKFSAIYAVQTFGIQGTELVLLFIFTNLVAVPGTLLAGYIADWIGERQALSLTLVGWIALMLWGALTQTTTGFWILAAGVAIGMGSTQAIARSLMARVIPAQQESEFFGFYVLATKVGAILAFLLFGAISMSTGNQRWAVLWLIPMFIVGLVLVWGVRPELARADASRDIPA